MACLRRYNIIIKCTFVRVLHQDNQHLEYINFIQKILLHIIFFNLLVSIAYWLYILRKQSPHVCHLILHEKWKEMFTFAWIEGKWPCRYMVWGMNWWLPRGGVGWGVQEQGTSHWSAIWWVTDCQQSSPFHHQSEKQPIIYSLLR